jgi:hypothetical protein
MAQDIITVRYKTNTYIASINGEKSSCTESADDAAKRLVEKVYGIPADIVTLNSLHCPVNGVYKFEVWFR